MKSLNLSSADHFCMAPWTNIHVSTMESLQPCCAGAGISNDLSQLSSFISDQNQELQAVKKHFLQNQQPPACQDCQERGWYSEFFHQAPIGANDFTLLSLDLRWSNICQLSCMYCNSSQSSSWAALEQKQHNMIPISRRIRDRESLIDLIVQNTSTIQRVSLLGGEPLLIKENIKVLELLSHDVEVNIFTGLNLDIETNAVYQRLIEMPNVYWTISMENVQDKFEFVRRGASWDQQTKNINRLLADNKSRYTVNIQSQFCVYSATSVFELYEFVRDLDIKINWNWLNYPKELDFAKFPDQHKSIALDQLTKVKSLSNNLPYVPQVDDLIEKLKASLGQGSQEHLLRCRQWHRDMESRYFGNRFHFESLWPEFA